MSLIMTANRDTWLKEDWRKQSSQLAAEDKELIKRGTKVEFVMMTETSLNQEEKLLNGHASVLLADDLEDVFLFVKHWDFPWDEETKPEKGILPTWHEIDWYDFKAPVSKYFTVGEVCLYQTIRIPDTDEVKINVVKYAREKDKIRKWLGCGMLLTSWYRPLSLGIGSPLNHPKGFASDWYPSKGSIWDVQARFEREWFKTGKWHGGFGRGAAKGFIHTDTRDPHAPRIWNY